MFNLDSENDRDSQPEAVEPPLEINAAQMRQVLEVSRMLAITSDLDKLLRRIAESTTNLLECERASIFLYDSRSDELWTRVALQSRRFDCHRAGNCRPCV